MTDHKISLDETIKVSPQVVNDSVIVASKKIKVSPQAVPSMPIPKTTDHEVVSKLKDIAHSDIFPSLESLENDE